MNATADYVIRYVYPAAAALLPEPMDRVEAWRMLTAIGLQESRFTHRAQVRGPARGFWQFERAGGVAGVLEHVSTRRAAEGACAVLGYPATAAAVYTAIEDNDVLAACFARLLLWTSPRSLPRDAGQGVDGWTQYLATWRPGKPHPQTWAGYYAAAWATDWPGTVRA